MPLWQTLSMQIINPTDTKRTAFVRGFWKGMAAPMMLFSAFELPAQAQPIAFQPLRRRPVQHASDWVRVGDALRAAVAKERTARGA